MQPKKTRFKDKNGRTICIGDWIHVEEYPGEARGGSLDYEGVVEELNDGTPIVTWYDLGYSEYTPLGYFKKAGREILEDTTC